MPKQKNKFFLINIGCKVNLYELSCIRNDLVTHNYVAASSINQANIIVINTCSVTANAAAKSRNIISRSVNSKLKPIVIVMGCYAQEVRKIPNNQNLPIVLGNQNKSKIITLLKKYLAHKKTINLVKDIAQCKKYENMSLPKFTKHTRAFLKIQDGCNLMCSYCLIPYIRGPQRSKDHKLVLEELKQIVRDNFKEIILTGINIGSYTDGSYTFYELLKDISKMPGDWRVRISSIEPQYLDEKIIKLFSKHPQRFCHHFHLSLQSANNKVLHDMRRRYTIEQIIKLVKMIRTYLPFAAITTDYIVGFPTENQQTFNNSLKNLEKIKFSWIHIFPYSRRKRTIADTLYKKDIQPKIIKEWTNTLSKLNSKCHEEFKRSLIGQPVKIVVQKSKNGFCYGYSGEYIYLKIRHKKAKRNDFISTKYTQTILNNAK